MNNAPDGPAGGQSNEDSPAGWNFFRVFFFIIGILVMAGFGFCSLCGLAIGGGSETEILLTFILPGLALAALGFALARWMYLRARRPKKP
jgi:hypothetical protein